MFLGSSSFGKVIYLQCTSRSQDSSASSTFVGVSTEWPAATLSLCRWREHSSLSSPCLGKTLSPPLCFHRKAETWLISYFDSSNDIAVELLRGVIVGVWRLVRVPAEGLNQAALPGPPAGGKKQLWLYSLAFVATSFLICFTGAAHEFPKEMLVFLKTESECIWHFWMSRTLGLLEIALS